MDTTYKNTQIPPRNPNGNGVKEKSSRSSSFSSRSPPPSPSSPPSPSVNNVDIMYSIVGRQEPPQLPLREEFMTNGVELVYNAKGVGQKVVCKEQKRREAKLLQKLKLIERKLEKKKSYQHSKKRRKALDTVKKLRKAMENSASGISYEMYLEELMKMRENIGMYGHDANGNAYEGPRTLTPVTSVEQIQGKLMDALELLDQSDMVHLEIPPIALADEESDSEMNMQSPMGGRSQGTADTSMETSMETSMDTTVDVEGVGTGVGEGQDVAQEEEERETPSITPLSVDDNSSVRTSEEKDAASWVGKGPGAGNSNSKTRQFTRTGMGTGLSVRTNQSSSLATLKVSNIKNIDGSFSGKNRSDEDSLEISSSFESSSSSLNIVRSPSSSSVRFKDVKPTVEDNITRARALIENARFVKRSFSNDSSSNSSIKPSDSYKGDRPLSKSPKFVPDTGRYHLFVSHACSWSHRTLIVRALKGLEHTVGATFVECKLVGQLLIDTTYVKDTNSDISFWSITGCNDDLDGTFKEFKFNFLDKQRSNCCARVPVLWDTVTKKIVTSKSTEIDWLFNFEFNRFARRPKLNLYPPGTKQEIDEMNRWIHDALSVGIYQCGIATTQDEYDRANDHLTRTLDRAEMIVRKRGFLTGQRLTESDIRLFVYLIRFDEIYRILFKTNARRIEKMPGLLEYVKDIYNVKGIKDVCDISAMKREYFGALVKKGDPFIVPQGSFMKQLERRSAVV